MTLTAPKKVGMERLNGENLGFTVTCQHTWVESAYIVGITGGGGLNPNESFQSFFYFDAEGNFDGYSENAASHTPGNYAVVHSEQRALDNGPAGACYTGPGAYWGYLTTTSVSIDTDSTGYHEWPFAVAGILAVAVPVYFMLRGWDKFKQTANLILGDDADEPWQHDEDYADWHEDRYGAEPMQRKKNWTRFHGL